MLHVFFGGGSLAGGKKLRDGPYYRRGGTLDSISALGRQQQLKLGGGSAYDFESVRDAAGTTHLFGQRSRFSTGSLVDLRVSASGRLLRPREIIHAGFDKHG